VCWRFLSTHLYQQHSSKKGNNYMFLRTYTLLLTYFSLVLELLSPCRNIHQIQVEYNENTLFRKAQKGKGGQWAKNQHNTRPSPQHHQHLDPPGSQPREGGGRQAHPRHGHARGMIAPYSLPPRPNFGWRCDIEVEAGGAGCAGEYSLRTACPRPI
jgi:hypothetical protein